MVAEWLQQTGSDGQQIIDAFQRGAGAGKK
jgi:hypothetical protein